MFDEIVAICNICGNELETANEMCLTDVLEIECENCFSIDWCIENE